MNAKKYLTLINERDSRRHRPLFCCDWLIYLCCCCSCCCWALFDLWNEGQVPIKLSNCQRFWCHFYLMPIESSWCQLRLLSYLPFIYWSAFSLSLQIQRLVGIAWASSQLTRWCPCPPRRRRRQRASKRMIRASYCQRSWSIPAWRTPTVKSCIASSSSMRACE